MKKRSPGIVWLLSYTTCFIYFFYWLFQTMEELNETMETIKIDIKKWFIRFASILSAYLILFGIVIFGISQESKMFFPVFILCFGLGIYWFVMLIKAMQAIGIQVRNLETERNKSQIINVKKMSILFFLYFTGIPYLQKHINSVVTENNEEAKSSKRAYVYSFSIIAILLIGLFVISFPMLGNIKDDITKTSSTIVLKNVDSQTSEAVLDIIKETNFSIWIKLNIEYEGKDYSNIHFIIEKDGRKIDEYDLMPGNAKIKIMSKKFELGKKVKESYTGKIGNIKLSTQGSYKISAISNFGSNLVKVNEWEIYLK